VCNCQYTRKNSAPTGQILKKFGICGFVKKSIDKNQVTLNSDKNNVRALYSQTDIQLWSHLAQSFLERQMFQAEVAEEVKPHILCPVTFFLKSCHLWDVEKLVEMGRPQMTIWRMRNACWIPKATYTHSDYVIIIAFAR
jgi:hypothetical protein